jgi:predicted secreted protein
MNWMSGIAVYVVLWWLVMFCVLPWGVAPAREAHLGHDSGAPANPRIAMKALIATGIATLLFGAVYLIVISDWISFRPVPN